MLGGSNQTLLCFSPGSFHSLCHGCRKSLIFSIFFVFFFVCSPSVHSISTAPLLYAVLQLPKGRLKHWSLCTLLIPAVFGLIFPGWSVLLTLGQEKQASSQSTRLLCLISRIPSCKVSSWHLPSCERRGSGSRGTALQTAIHLCFSEWERVLYMEKVHAGIMAMAIKYINNGLFYSGRKKCSFFKHLSSSEELLGIIPAPDLVHAVALCVK